MKQRLTSLGLLLALAAAFALPRLAGIGSFATIDEPWWLTAGADFYYALGQRAFANTLYDYHPAVTTMWVVMVGILLYFPQYRGFGQGYFEVEKNTLDRFLLAHDRTPLGLLTASRLVQAVLIVFLLLLVFWLLQRALGNRSALVSALLISFDPFFLGHSRLLNHEGMLSLLVTVSLLAGLCYLFFDRRWGYLALSGAAAGLAQLTKSSSIVLVGVIGLLFLTDVFLSREGRWPQRLLRASGGFLLWFAVLAATYFILWPGMWVAPADMLYQVYGNAFSYAFQGARLSVTGGLQPEQFQPLQFSDVGLYLLSLLTRTTPSVWVGAVLGVFAIRSQKREGRLVLLSLLLLGLLFVLLFGVARGRNSPHYVLSSYLALDIFAGAGWAFAAGWLAQFFGLQPQAALPRLALWAAVLLQAASALMFYPYYYTYTNPIVDALQAGPASAYGYGEGLELAASYLAGKPGAQDMTVLSYYGHGPFSYFFPGKTEILKSIYGDIHSVPELEGLLAHSDYLVIYYAVQKPRNSLGNILDALDSVQPEKTIWLSGAEYVRIYRVDALPPDFYKSLEKSEIPALALR